VDPSKDHEGKQQSELFAEIARHEVFQPTKIIYPPMAVGELAAQAPETIV
jgi:hypothetical protein